MTDCRGDLLQRVRHGLATDQERLALGAHLTSCRSCALLQDVATDFDRVGEVQLRDIDLVARFADKARSVVPMSNVIVQHFGKLPPRLSRPARLGKMAAAALILSGLSAAAYSWSDWPRRAVAVTMVHPDMKRADSRQLSSKDHPLTGTDAATVQVPAPVAIVVAQAVGVRELGVGPQKTNPLPARSRVETSASAVYKSANDARRSGQTKVAIALYLQLQSSYSQSTEAALSRVSLGGLYLENGSAKAALAQFDAYILSANRRLAAEALFGKGQALESLGRGAEEVQNWQRLLRQYPSSAYATHAQERLQRLL